MGKVLVFKPKRSEIDSRRVETAAKQRLAMSKAIAVCERMIAKCERNEKRHDG
jgi:hypothetical protein